MPRRTDANVRGADGKRRMRNRKTLDIRRASSEAFPLDNLRAEVYNKNEERRWPHSSQLPHTVSHFTGKHDRRSFGRIGRSFFLPFFGIMLCPRLVPKDIPRNHPCHIDDTDDDCSQKVQCGKNNIQNIHDGLPPLGISCVYIRNRQEDDKKLNFLLTRHNVTRGREHDRCTCRQHLSSTKYHKMWQNTMLSETYIKTRSPFGIGRTRGASRCSLMAILHKRYQHVPDIIVCSSLKKVKRSLPASFSL